MADTEHHTARSRVINVIDKGLMPYQAAWDLQKRLAEQRAADHIPDTLILIQHPHTYTIGRSGERNHLLLTPEVCEERGITVLDVDRGGDITYHGPGQLVVYPILDLGRPDPSGLLPKADYVGYLRRLEEVLIRTIAPFGLKGQREEGYTGVWVEDNGTLAKIAAIGVRVNARGISTHGVALNVTPDLAYFQGIVPCGITDRPVTSMQALLGEAPPPMPLVKDTFIHSFTHIFAGEH